MSIRIHLKNSGEEGAEPQPSDLELGELGLSTHTSNPAIWMKDTAGNVVKIAGKGSVNTAPAATTDEAGIVELATAEETGAGTSDSKAVTPAGLATVVGGVSPWEINDSVVELRQPGDKVFISSELALGQSIDAPGVAIGENGFVALKEGLYVEGVGVSVGNSAVNPNAEILEDGTFKGKEVVASRYNGGPLAGFRNHLMNGCFRIQQRYDGSATSPQYITDRWYISGDNISAQLTGQNWHGSPYPYILQGGALTNFALSQMIELTEPGYGFPYTRIPEWTLSYWSQEACDCKVMFADDVTGTNKVDAIVGEAERIEGDKTGDGRYQHTVTFPDNPQSTNLGVLVSISYKSKSYSVLAGIQFEPGDRATEFESRPKAVELEMCQRYYQIRSTSDVDPLDLRPTMRTTPTVADGKYDADFS